MKRQSSTEHAHNGVCSAALCAFTGYNARVISRRADERTVRILRMCVSGGWMRLLRRASAKSNELVLEITQQSADGRCLDGRLTLGKQ